MTFQILSVLATLWVTCPAQENGVMTVAMPLDSNWGIGTTLDSFFNSGLPTPFTTASTQKFEEDFDNASIDDYGQYVFDADIVIDQDSKMEFLGFDSSLSASFMGVTVDAHMSYARDHVDCESDVSLLIRASASGRRKQLSLSEWNALELKVTAKEELVLDAFLQEYGQYLIVGFIYGGEFLFASTHSAQSETDKLAIEAGLKVSFGEAGFGFSFGLNDSKSDIQKSIDSETSWSIRPNVASDASSNLISAISSLSIGGMDENASLYDDLAQSAKGILEGDDLDAITAVVIPLSSVTAVHDLFADSSDTTDTAAFFEFLNGIYMEESALKKQLDLVEHQWENMLFIYDGLSEDYPLPVQLIGDWDHRFTLLRTEMSRLNSMEEIVNHSKVYLATLDDKIWTADFMTADSFLDVTARGMNQQFDDAILEPYREMLLAAPTPSPTQAPSPPPVGPIPVVDRGNIYGAGQSCVGDSCLGECEGECDSDDHCETGLKCWYRDLWDQSLPPGCSGTAHNNDHDYCYDPDENIKTVNKGSNPSFDLGECEGDCDGDSQCIGNLKCWDRYTWNSNLPPGCKGSAFEKSHDFCYDNTKDHSNALPPDDAPSARTAAFGYSVLKGPARDSFIRHDDAIESGDYVFVLNSSALWMLAAVLCVVFSAATAVMVCRGNAKKKQYRVVAAMSDTDCV